jgi:hypothetical protein
VESLNFCQTIVRQKRRILPSYFTANMLQKACEKFEFLSNICSAKKAYCTGIEQSIFKKNYCGSKQFVKLTARIKSFVTGNKSAEMYTNCRHFFTVFVAKMPATKT